MAREYQMEQLTERCEKYLLQREKTPHQAIDFLAVAKICASSALKMPITELRRQETCALIAPENGKQLAQVRVGLLENKIPSSSKRG